MWRDEVAPRLARRNVGQQEAHEVLRLAGIGESALVELIGEEVLRGQDPEVATYARADAIDLRVSAHGPGAAERVAAMVDDLVERVGGHVFARGAESWPEAIGSRLAGRSLAIVEVGMGGQLIALLGDAGYVRRAELRSETDDNAAVAELAGVAREEASTDIGVAALASGRVADTPVVVAVATARGVNVEERTAFLAGAEGRRRAALAACLVLWQALGDEGRSAAD